MPWFETIIDSGLSGLQQPRRWFVTEIPAKCGQKPTANFLAGFTASKASHRRRGFPSRCRGNLSYIPGHLGYRDYGGVTIALRGWDVSQVFLRNVPKSIPIKIKVAIILITDFSCITAPTTMYSSSTFCRLSYCSAMTIDPSLVNYYIMQQSLEVLFRRQPYFSCTKWGT